MQITNEETSKKITGTAEKADQHRLGEHFDQLIIFFLLPRKPGMPKNFAQPPGGPRIGCWDLADLLTTTGNLPDVAALAAAAKVLDEELGPGAADALRPSLHTLPRAPQASSGARVT